MKLLFKTLIAFVLTPLIYFCLVSYSYTEKEVVEIESKSSKIEKYYQKNKGNSLASVSVGSVSNGYLKNGKLIPFSGKNFRYFDSFSYLKGRAFLHGKVLKTILNSYKLLEKSVPLRMFTVMECSHEHGGKLWPHRTHQNGLSVDFMMPLIKNGNPYYELDDKGVKHYLLKFDNKGRLQKDLAVKIDFNVVATQILQLNKSAISQGYQIKKVIIKIELKDELFASIRGKELKNSGIYIVQGLTKTINDLHDDHFHIDFEKNK